MKYSYKPHLFSRAVEFRFTSHAVQLLRADGSVKRKINWSFVKSIQLIDMGPGRDAKKGEIRIIELRIKPKIGRNIKVRSASFVHSDRPIAVECQLNQFKRVCEFVRTRLSESNDDAVVTYGSLGIAVLAIVASFVTSGLGIFAVVALVLSRKPLLELLPYCLVAVFFSILSTPTFAAMARGYWPTSQRIQEVGPKFSKMSPVSSSNSSLTLHKMTR